VQTREHLASAVDAVAEYEKIFNKKRLVGFPADSKRLANHLRRNQDVLKRGGILVEQLQRTASERGWWIRRAPVTAPAEPTTVKVSRPGTKANELVREIDAVTDSQKGGRTSAA
jgi:hypothetical protein